MGHSRQSDDTFNLISQLIWKHLEERDWHNLPPRSLAISLSLEANELLEHFQWSDKPVGDREALASELADIIIYAFEFAQQTDIDIADAIKKKLKKTAEKYPAEVFKGKKADDRHAHWLEAKMRHKKDGL